MMTNKGQIKNTEVLVLPSEKLRNFIKDLPVIEDTPFGIQCIQFKNKPKDTAAPKCKLQYLVTDEDKQFIKSLKLPEISKEPFDQEKSSYSSNKPNPTAKLLTLQDLHWLYKYIREENKTNNKKVHLHQLFEGSEILLPQNEEIPRNEELEKRCQKLKADQKNKEYQQMTKNVDGFRRKLPEDTIGYQLKMMNSHLIAVFQFIVSVAAGFAFGFMGIELLAGTLDFGFRLMLGIICGLIVALAELYFLAKTLNEDMEFEYQAKNPNWKQESKKTK